MNISHLRPRTQLLLSVLIPLGCIGLVAAMVLPSLSRLAKMREDLEVTEKTVQQKQQVIKQAEEAAGGRPLALAVVVADEQEPIIFLRQLAALTAESGVTLAAVRETTPPPPPTAVSPQPLPSPTAPPAPSPGGQPTGGGLSGERPVVPPVVRELTNQVTVEGTFGQLLALLVRLEKFERILSVSQCRISSRGGLVYPRLQAIFTLSRFVASPPPSQGSAAP